MKISVKYRNIAAGVLLASLGVMTAGTGHAHHPVSAKFDESMEIQLQGHVTKVDWRNPHTHIFINVESADGEVTNWAVELESPVVLRQHGWRENSVAAGDQLTIRGIQARDGSRQIWGERIVRPQAPQNELFSLQDRKFLQKDVLKRPAPRWPDGQPALGAVPGGASGYWSYPTKSSLYEDDADVTFNEYGRLEDIGDAKKVAPFQPWALSLYERRQERGLQDDPMYLNCKPPGGPRQFQSNLGVQLIEDHQSERVFVLMAGGNRNFRLLYLDGRDGTGQIGGDDDNPLYYGRSVGQWEDGTLVVETNSFNEDFWFSNGGLPHTSQLSMEERFTRVDHDTLRYEVTIDDPGAYTRPWTASWEMRWMGGEELPSHFCQNNRM